MSDQRPWWRPDGFLLYAIIYLTFIYLPVLFLPLFSFNNSKYIAFPLKGFTLKWYYQMVNRPDLLEALLNSVKVGLIVAIVSTILGLLASKALTRYRLPGRGPIISFIMIPLVIPRNYSGNFTTNSYQSSRHPLVTVDSWFLTLTAMHTIFNASADFENGGF